jgi:hypothetical protein
MKKAFFMIFVTILAIPAYSQVFYHCVKDGEKLVSDRPCERFGATENKRVRTVDMPPINAIQPLSEKERLRAQAITGHQKRNEQEHIEQKKYQKQKAEDDKRLNNKKCADLWRYKNQIVASQRKLNSEWLNSEHRRVNDEIYRLNCGS